jgi:SAM-dependent methyltransferase
MAQAPEKTDQPETTNQHDSESIREAVKKHYAEAITAKGSCCGPKTIQIGEIRENTAGKFARLAGYTFDELAGIPDGATSFGCGNPVALLEVGEGHTVLDLGSGAGLDMILASKKVGRKGRVIGLDMTPEMIDICRQNLNDAGITNAEVRQGTMEAMPVKDEEVDWIISNCVINLSPEKKKVFAEAFRVLKPGGRVMVSDIVTYDLPEEYRGDMTAWVGCLAGAVEETEYLQLMREAGFEDVRIVDKLMYDEATIGTLAGEACGCGDESAVSRDMVKKYANKVASVRVSATKPR